MTVEHLTEVREQDCTRLFVCPKKDGRSVTSHNINSQLLCPDSCALVELIHSNPQSSPIDLLADHPHALVFEWSLPECVVCARPAATFACRCSDLVESTSTLLGSKYTCGSKRLASRLDNNSSHCALASCDYAYEIQGVEFLALDTDSIWL